MHPDCYLSRGHRQTVRDLEVRIALRVEHQEPAVLIGHPAVVERPDDEVLADDPFFRAVGGAVPQIRSVVERDLCLAARAGLVDATVAHGSDHVSHEAAPTVAPEILAPAVEEDVVYEGFMVEA